MNENSPFVSAMCVGDTVFFMADGPTKRAWNYTRISTMSNDSTHLNGGEVYEEG